MTKNFNLDSGQVLVVVLLFLIVVLITTLSIFSLVSFFTRNATLGYFTEQALHLAEAGVDKAIHSVNTQGSSYSGETDTKLASGTFTVTILDFSIGVKEITATGFVPNSVNPTSKKTVKVRITSGTEIIAFRYAAQVGTGGLNMANSATVRGNVYSNGNITGSGSSKIEGDAYAVGMISSPRPIVTGTRYDNQPASEIPTIDYQKWKDKATAGGVTNCTPTCIIKNSTSIGPAKYQGNLAITNNSQVIMEGPVYVTGNFSISQGQTTLKPSEGFGSAGTILIVDGTINLTQGGLLQPTTASPPGYLLLITTSKEASAIQISQAGATAVFYALEGGAQLTQTADVAALVAKTLTMAQQAKLTYNSSLASASFIFDPGAVWKIQPGTYKID